MNHFLYGLARAIAETFELPEPIVEIGSYQVDGQEAIANLRTHFRGKEYLGVDMRPGPGVDRVADVEALPFGDQSVGTVIAMSTFEHVPHFWRGFEEIYRVLRPDGALIVCCPFYFPLPSYPSDYWRFTPEALKVLLEGYPSQIVGWHGPPRRPINVWAVAFREQAPPIQTEQFQQYQRLLMQYGKQPLRWGKRVRYKLGRWLCGARPFGPYLEQERWQTELYHHAPQLAGR